MPTKKRGFECGIYFIIFFEEKKCQKQVNKVEKPISESTFLFVISIP
jgi:hypothetical protein